MARTSPLTPVLRTLLGVIGVAAVIAGAAVGAFELRHGVWRASFPAVVVALFCAVVVCGGALLVQGAWRGRITVRDPAGRGSREDG